MACLAAIFPIMLDDNGNVLYHGRQRRLASRSQRRALKTMYQTCATPAARWQPTDNNVLRQRRLAVICPNDRYETMQPTTHGATLANLPHPERLWAEVGTTDTTKPSSVREEQCHDR